MHIKDINICSVLLQGDKTMFTDILLTCNSETCSCCFDQYTEFCSDTLIVKIVKELCGEEEPGLPQRLHE